MRLKYLFLVSSALMCASTYSADHLNAEATTEIAQKMRGQGVGFEVSVNGFIVKKVQDPTASSEGILLEEVSSAIEKSLEKHHYKDNGEYVILVNQPLEGQNIYRVIKFEVNNNDVSKIKEIALVELTEHIKEQAEARVHAEELVHNNVNEGQVIALAPEHVHQVVTEDRVHEMPLEDHVHQEARVHAEELVHNNANEEQVIVPAPEHIHQEARVHTEEPSFLHRLTGMFGGHDKSDEHRVHDVAEHIH